MYLPVSTPWAMGDQTTWEMPELLATVGTTSASMTRQSIGVLRLVGDQLEAEVLGQRVAVAELVRGPLADADVEHLALPDEVGERLHGLLQRRLVVVAVRLVEVDVVGLQPAAASRSTASMMCLRDSPRSLWPLGPVGPKTLVKISSDSRRSPLQRLAEHRLGLGVGVDVGGVEGGDAGVQRRPHAGRGLLVLHLGAVGQPVAVRDFGDLEAGVAEISKVHVDERTQSARDVTIQGVALRRSAALRP